MKSVVIIPCWRRPEFLGACLELIKRAEGWENYHYLFAIDRMADKQIRPLIDAFTGEKTIIHAVHKWHGNSTNLIRAYVRAHEIGGELTFLIEEDIFIGRDFFTFHEQVHTEFNTFFVTACRNQMDLSQSGTDASGLFEFGRYQSLGISFKTANLSKIIIHDSTHYYSNRTRYLRRLFPKSSFGDSNTEQDGLICRIMEAEGLTGMFPQVARAFHAGFYGYNRPGLKIVEKNLSLQDKIKLLLEMPESEMNSRAIRMKDIARCELSQVHKVDKFHINDPRNPK